MDLRRIVQRNGSYQVLKTDKNGELNLYGRQIKTVRGVYNFLRNLNADSEIDAIEIDSNTQKAIGEYELIYENSRKIRSELASKVI